MRAMEPRESGYAMNPDDGVRLYYEVFGPTAAERTIAFLPAWHLVYGRLWKMQIPYFAQRGFRVIVYDPRGNGKSDRPERDYHASLMLGDAMAVLKHAGIERATVATLSQGVALGTMLAVERPELVERLILIGGSSISVPRDLTNVMPYFDEKLPNRDGWNKFNAVHWREDYQDFVEWFISMIFPEPYSSKAIEDGVGWGLETTSEVLINGRTAGGWGDALELAPRVTCPVLIIHGENDLIAPVPFAYQARDLFPDARLVVMDGAGHNPPARHPVKTSELIHDFIGRELTESSVYTWSLARSRRALFVSSPIGLGHAQRDLAIANELRKLIPDLQIDWLAQHPVTELLRERGERIHPMSDRLAGESGHIESWVTDAHTLNVFMSIRDMDEILAANFYVFRDAVRETTYDLWICDEAWDIDHFLFENPELKTAPYVWLTDVVGFLPGNDETATDWERYVAADYNAELIEQIDRYPSLRDRSFYIGDPDDLVDRPLGPGLPTIPEWTQRTHEFTGYIRYFDPEALPAQGELRQRFGLPNDRRVAVASTGGTSVGYALLRRIIESWPAVQAEVPDLMLLVVGGPRVDLADLPNVEGIDYRGYVPRLYELFAAADVALVQGGLSTTMELVALDKPFLYFPLQEHFEQQHHVSHRLEQYGVPEWARIQFPDATTDLIASRVNRALSEPMSYRPVDADGARRVAERIAPLLTRATSDVSVATGKV